MYSEQGREPAFSNWAITITPPHAEVLWWNDQVFNFISGKPTTDTKMESR